MGLILDTNFVVNSDREGRRGQPGRATAFFGSRPNEDWFITFTVAGELASGKSAADRRVWANLCRPYKLLEWSLEISWQYGVIYRQLQSRGTPIGTNDLWIAATALFHGMPVVTNNVREFERVEGLTIITY